MELTTATTRAASIATVHDTITGTDPGMFIRAEGPRKARTLNSRDGFRDVYKGGGSSKSQVLK